MPCLRQKLLPSLTTISSQIDSGYQYFATICACHNLRQPVHTTGEAFPSINIRPITSAAVQRLGHLLSKLGILQASSAKRWDTNGHSQPHRRSAPVHGQPEAGGEFRRPVASPVRDSAGASQRAVNGTVLDDMERAPPYIRSVPTAKECSTSASCQNLIRRP